jgi:hypothetical protein
MFGCKSCVPNIVGHYMHRWSEIISAIHVQRGPKVTSLVARSSLHVALPRRICRLKFAPDSRRITPIDSQRLAVVLLRHIFGGYFLWHHIIKFVPAGE